ncbi:unnamed protein product [Prunus armeniaca]
MGGGEPVVRGWDGVIFGWFCPKKIVLPLHFMEQLTDFDDMTILILNGELEDY